MYEFTTLTVHEKSFLTNCGITPNVFYFNAFSLAFKKDCVLNLDLINHWKILNMYNIFFLQIMH